MFNSVLVLITFAGLMYYTDKHREVFTQKIQKIISNTSHNSLYYFDLYFLTLA